MRILPLATSLLLVPALASAEVLWRGDFETGNISQWDGKPQMVSADRLAVVTSPVAEGRYALQATVVQGDDPIDASGNRNELVRYDGNEVEGTEYYYRWSTMFAEDFPAPATWQVFVQWHHTGNTGSPPMEFTVKNESIKLEVGADVVSVWSTPLVRGVWHEFIFHVKWSADPSKGFVELYHNRELVLPKRNMATMYPGQSNYMKAGLYRSDTIAPVGRLWHDGFIQATTLADVMTAQGTPDAGTGTQPGTDAGTPPTGGGSEQPADGGTAQQPGDVQTQQPATLTPPLPGEPDAVRGCTAAGGTPWLAGLLGLAGLALRRRRYGKS